MLITPVNNLNIFARQYKPQKNINFGAHYDFGQIKENRGDGIIYQNGNIHNYSCLIRDLQLFLEMPKLLEKKFPNGVKIFDYGCSAGYEPASVVLGLHNNAPDKVALYTPIIARDNNSQIIKNAKKYKLKFEDDELQRLNYFENINKSDFFIPGRKSSDGQKIYELTDKLKNEITFEEGDLFEDLDKGKLSEEPCVILFRNAWQFLTDKGATELSEKLYKNLQPHSIVIIGANDVNYANAHKHLLNAGFKNVKEKFPVELKDPVLSARYKDLIYFNPTTKISTYCFEKV